MKRIFAAALLAASMSLFAGNAAKAQGKFGIKGGLNVTSMSLNSEVFDASNRTGFFIGPTVKFTLPIVGLGVDASALYDQRESKVKAEFDDRTCSSTLKTAPPASISLPVRSSASTWVTRTSRYSRIWESGV